MGVKASSAHKDRSHNGRKPCNQEFTITVHIHRDAQAARCGRLETGSHRLETDHKEVIGIIICWKGRLVTVRENYAR